MFIPQMTVESPQGLKANLLRTFGSSGAGVVTEKQYDTGCSKSGWRPLLFGLCLFNSVIHERKKYGTLGWNIPYEFNDSDLEVRCCHRVFHNKTFLNMCLIKEEEEDGDVLCSHSFLSLCLSPSHSISFTQSFTRLQSSSYRCS